MQWHRIGWSTLEEINNVQNNLDTLEKLAENNIMKFNRDKCKILYLETGNQMHMYGIGDTWLSNSIYGKKSWHNSW